MAEDSGTTTAGIKPIKKIDGASVSSSVSQIKSGIERGLDKVGSFLEDLGIDLPKPNPLHDYASYTYLLGLTCIPTAYENNPDETYIKSNLLPLICKSASMDPGNRVNTLYGAYDFFIDNLEIESNIARGSTGNVYKIEFTVTEPYSFGLFLIALEQAARESEYENWRDATFLLTIDFKGNRHTGELEAIAMTSRQIPIKLLNISISTDQGGTKYTCSAYKSNLTTVLKEHGTLQSDVSIKGKTVQEILQTGESSLQVVLNQRLKQLKTDGNIDVPDQIIIIFPNDSTSRGSPGTSGIISETASKLLISGTASEQSIYKKLGVTKSAKNDTYVQPDGDCNEIGRASLGASVDKKGATPLGKESAVYDEKTKKWKQGDLTVEYDTLLASFKPRQKIIDVIDQVISGSTYATRTLDRDQVSSTGMRKWWNIEPQCFVIDSDENYKSTGRKPKILVFRVVPYKGHVGKLMATNTKPPGVETLKREVPKEYNYIYTGKSTDIINFNIEYGVSVVQGMASDSFGRTGDNKTKQQLSGAADKKSSTPGLQSGSGKKPEPGSNPTQVSWGIRTLPTDNQGGAGKEDAAVRAARLFHHAMLTHYDMINLDMEIVGDPDWIVHSGTGNYSARPAKQNGLNSDGTIDWQSGEVYITVNFRSPLDISEKTSLYNFSGSSTMVGSEAIIGPSKHLSGLYHIISVTSYFNNGVFKQRLSGVRMNGQELNTETDLSSTFSATLSDITNLFKELLDFF